MQPSKKHNPLVAAITSFLSAHPPLDSDIQTLLSQAPRRYDIYPPLLLLPSQAFTSQEWINYLLSHSSFFPSLAELLNATHIATTSPISSGSAVRAPKLRHLHPLPPGAWDDLWVTTTQNRIVQTWNPEHTMFSRGNIMEKARMLSLPDVEGREIADLYAGIGYFVFSYLKAGAKRVWCWEINPYSIGALRRGAAMNGWRCRMGAEEDRGEEVVVWEESNQVAVGRMLGRRVAHVNLGLLPTSRAAWGQAVGIVEVGGCVHVHENVGESEFEEKKGEVVRELARLAGKEVKCEHVQKVKTFAPGVWHVVFDVRIGEY